MWSLLTDHRIAAQFLTHGANARKQKLADLVGRLSIQLFKESFVDSRSSSTILVYFSGVLGSSADPTTFERPRIYTSKLSGLTYCARLCFLEAVLPRFAHEPVGWEKRPRHGGLKLLDRVRELYMCLDFQSPLRELLSLRGSGRSLSRSDGPSPMNLGSNTLMMLHNSFSCEAKANSKPQLGDICFVEPGLHSGTMLV